MRGPACKLPTRHSAKKARAGVGLGVMLVEQGGVCVCKSVGSL
eukprot:COSAG02_NODE_10714_length_1875_cov_3.233108_1_plen_43_part_00